VAKKKGQATKMANEITAFVCRQCGGALDPEDPLCPYCRVPWSMQPASAIYGVLTTGTASSYYMVDYVLGNTITPFIDEAS